METLTDIFDMLKYLQDHGGIILSVLTVGVFMEARMQRIERRSVDRDSWHELYYHHVELKKREKHDDSETGSWSTYAAPKNDAGKGIV